jgi:pyruvate carboxylase
MLARRCAEEGIVFVGPSPEALELFGDKAKPRRWPRACGVPVIEGTTGPTTLDEAKAFFASLGAAWRGHDQGDRRRRRARHAHRR